MGDVEQVSESLKLAKQRDKMWCYLDIIPMSVVYTLYMCYSISVYVPTKYIDINTLCVNLKRIFSGKRNAFHRPTEFKLNEYRMSTLSFNPK